MIFKYDSDTKILSIRTRTESSVMIQQIIADKTLVEISAGGSVVGVKIFDPGSTDEWGIDSIITNYQLDFSVADGLLKLYEHAYLFTDL